VSHLVERWCHPTLIFFHFPLPLFHSIHQLHPQHHLIPQHSEWSSVTSSERASRSQFLPCQFCSFSRSPSPRHRSSSSTHLPFASIRVMASTDTNSERAESPEGRLERPSQPQNDSAQPPGSESQVQSLTTVTPPKIFRFLALPAEIRVMIYSLLLLFPEEWIYITTTHLEPVSTDHYLDISDLS